MGKSALDALRELDAFPKTLDEFRVRTSSGGMISVAALTLVTLLAAGELWSTLFSREATRDVVVDSALLDTLTIHFDLSFPRLTCNKIAVEAMDAVGEAQDMAKHAVFKLGLDANGYAVGHAQQQDAGEGTVLMADDARRRHAEGEEAGEEADKPAPRGQQQHTKCGSCYGVPGTPEPMRCCNTCADVQEAFRFRGWEWRPERAGRDRFWQCREEHLWSKASEEAHRALELRDEAGCEVFGAIFVAKAKGSFHFGPAAGAGGNTLLALLGLVDDSFDVSHTVHYLWFGDTRPEVATAALAAIDTRQAMPPPPLNGLEQSLQGEPSVVQYYVQVIATTLVKATTRADAFQYAATEHVRRVAGGALPAVHFFYDTPPLRLQYVERKKTWAHYYTNMCAMVGGVFSVSALIDSIVHKRKTMGRKSSSFQ